MTPWWYKLLLSEQNCLAVDISSIENISRREFFGASAPAVFNVVSPRGTEDGTEASIHTFVQSWNGWIVDLFNSHSWPHLAVIAVRRLEGHWVPYLWAQVCRRSWPVELAGLSILMGMVGLDMLCLLRIAGPTKHQIAWGEWSLVGIFTLWLQITGGMLHQNNLVAFFLIKWMHVPHISVS